MTLFERLNRASVMSQIKGATRRCQKCKHPTNGEEALIDGQWWCHPCADGENRPLKGEATS